MDKVRGSMGLLSDMQITADMEGLDAQSKTLLRNREVLAVILQGVAEEYEGCSRKEIMGLIEPVSLQKEVSPGRTNTQVGGVDVQVCGEDAQVCGEDPQVCGEDPRVCMENPQVRGENPEFVLLNEKTAIFDLFFKARDPRLSTGDVQVSLHIDIEMQKKSKVPYPIEKRGLYYLARSLSSQLSLVTEMTDYSQLEKCYSIWICRDDIPVEGRYSISFYGIANMKDVGGGVGPRGKGSRRGDLERGDLGRDDLEGGAKGRAASKKDYDLMTLVVIRLGHKVYNGKKEDEGYSLLRFRFLNTIMYPHREDFMQIVSEYVDFSENEELWKEVTQVDGLGWRVFEEGREEGREEGIEKGIQAMIVDNLEEQVPKERIILKLQKHFSLPQEKAEQYYEGAVMGL